MSIRKLLALALLAPLPALGQMADPAVVQSNIHETICVPGWSRAHRPNLARAKRAALVEAGIPVSHAGRYEYDHMIPLELGGEPRDRANLTLQLWAEARRKDVMENRLHDLVCADRMTLAAARACMARWPKCP